MNWYHRHCAYGSSALSKKASYDYKHQDNQRESFSDALRYTFDSYVINISKNRMPDQITVSAVMNHNYLGSLIFNWFVSFDLNQDKEASSALDLMTKETKRLMTKFMEEQIPPNLLSSYLRQAYLEGLGRDSIIKTNIPSINYSYDLDNVVDWRKSIYGNRYPNHVERSFSQNLSGT